MQRKRLEELLAKFKKQRVLVVGDYYLDGYWEVDQTRSQLSLETPWHVNPVVAQRYYPGAEKPEGLTFTEKVQKEVSSHKTQKRYDKEHRGAQTLKERRGGAGHLLKGLFLAVS